MPRRDGREQSPTRRLVIGLLVIASAAGGLLAIAAVVFFLAEQTVGIGRRRDVAEQAAQAYCQKAGREDCESLKAQIRSVRADEDAVDVAVGQLWLNVLGLGGLAFTVLYARRAWVEAQRSANAANDAVEETRRNALRELRAYVSVMDLRIIYDERTDDVSATFSIGNFGLTPAREVEFASLIDVAQNSPKGKSGIAAGRPGFKGEIWPSGIIPGDDPRKSISHEEVTRIVAGQAVIYVQGRVVYEDVFDYRHTLYFCAYKKGPKWSDGEPMILAAGANFTKTEKKT